jgi:hypothetical protein
VAPWILAFARMTGNAYPGAYGAGGWVEVFPSGHSPLFAESVSNASQ